MGVRAALIFSATVLFGLSYGARADSDRPECAGLAIKGQIFKYLSGRNTGPCACPEDQFEDARTDTKLKRCGALSAYSRGGGQQPVCYLEDIKEGDAAWLKATLKCP